MRKIFAIVLTIAAVLQFIFYQETLAGQPTQTMSAAEIQLALKKLTVLGSALHIAAHPDDENTALLAYLSNERLLRTAYLSVTRGDGGQNLIGTETGELLGVIRTQELLAARAIDRAEQFFTRAVDFGYSKSSDETLEIWGKEKILSDVVWVIRKFRPDVIITRFTSDVGGHGHHTSSASLAEEAFHAAADPNRFPEQLQFVEPWQAKRIVWNGWHRYLESRNIDVSKLVSVDLGAFNPLLGEAYTEIYSRSRSMHKSQGFGAGSSRGTFPNYFLHTAGDSAEKDLFEDIDLSWNRVPNGSSIGKILQDVHRNFNPENPSASLPALLRAYEAMEKAPDNYWVEVKRKELQNVIRACAGIWIEAIAEEHSAVPGGAINLTAMIVNRSTFPFKLERIILPFDNGDTLFQQLLLPNQPIEWKTSLRLPENAEYTHPYWLKNTPEKGAFSIHDPELIGSPVQESPLQVEFSIVAGWNSLTYRTPLLYRWVDRVDGELYRPVEIAPEVTTNLNEAVYIFPDHRAKEIVVRLRAGEANVSGNLRLVLGAGWKGDPESVPFSLQDKYEEQSIRFRVYPPEAAGEGSIGLIAEVNGKRLSRSYVRIEYAHFPIQTLYPPASAKLVRLDLHRGNEKVAYIMGSGDDIPKSLEQIGYEVTLLTDEDIEAADLSQFDVIITGIRAYNTRNALARNHQRLMDYVKAGGALIDQYNTTWGLLLENIGPYPFKISRDRVSVEEAPVEILRPDHPLLNYPNKITPDDFEGWVQERGLYFGSDWDSAHYQTLLASHDPGEPATEGGLLYARYGDGHYIYSGLSWFRQLPAGVPGAYRLFVNMISMGSQDEKRAEVQTH